jgi:exonuclease VII small subunit
MENSGHPSMKATKLSKNLAAQISAHQKVEQRVVVLVKAAEATHTEHRKAKAAYKVAKKTARSAKMAWHRARILAREGQSMLKKSTKRLAKVRSQRSQSSSKE